MRRVFLAASFETRSLRRPDYGDQDCFGRIANVNAGARLLYSPKEASERLSRHIMSTAPPPTMMIVGDAGQSSA